MTRQFQHVMHAVLRTFVTCVLIACLSCTHLGCAQLIALPFQLIVFVLVLPFQILRIVIGLLPLAIKYAPLALLFVSNKNNDSIDELEYIIDELNRDAMQCAVTVYPISSEVSCYRFAFLKPLDDNAGLVKHIEEILAQQQEACIVFTGDMHHTDAPETLASIWQYMVQAGIKIGRDERLHMPSVDPCEES